MTEVGPKVTRVVGPDPAGIAEAGAALRRGGLVAFPTETVYGLGADATDPAAVARLYSAKGRPRFNPLIAHVTTLDAALAQGRFAAEAALLAEAFWPGPLTLVVPVAESVTVCELARAGLSTVALRVPAHPVARALLEAAGRPIAAPSANRSGRVSATEPAHVLADLGGRIDMLLDAGPTPVGVESTILACLGREVRMLRPGGVSRERIEAVLGRGLAEPQPDGAEPLSPGRLASHYAPAAAMRLDAVEVRPGEALLAFGADAPAGAGQAVATVNLSASGDLVEAAARLFSALRELDASGAPVIAVAPIPRTGIGEAIADRLARAAAPRPGGPAG